MQSYQPCWVNLRFITGLRMYRNHLQIELTIPLQCWPLSGVYSMSLATGQNEQCLNFFMAAQWAFKRSSALPTVLTKKQANTFLISFSSLIRATINLMKDIVCFYFQLSFSQWLCTEALIEHHYLTHHHYTDLDIKQCISCH